MPIYPKAANGTDDDAIHDNISAEISAITEKTTPVSADLILIEDSASSNVKKKVQIGNLTVGKSYHFLVPDSMTDDGFTQATSFWQTMALLIGDRAYFKYKLPPNFASFDSIALVLIPDASETIDFDFSQNYAANGEVTTTGSNTQANITQAVTVNTLEKVDLSSYATTGLAANDYFSIRISSNIDNLRLIGLEFVLNLT